MIIFKLLLAWQLEADLLVIAGIKNLSAWPFDIILSSIMWNILVCMSLSAYIPKNWQMLMKVLMVCLNANNVSKSKIYSFFTSRSECVRCNRLRHNIASMLLISSLTINCEPPQAAVNYIKLDFLSLLWYSSAYHHQQDPSLSLKTP